jgi:hypothetical protein
MKLFSKTTYAQRNELLETDAPFSNMFKPITSQEAELRILRGREIAISFCSVPPAPNHNNTLRTTLNNTTNQRSMAETSPI